MRRLPILLLTCLVLTAGCSSSDDDQRPLPTATLGAPSPSSTPTPSELPSAAPSLSSTPTTAPSARSEAVDRDVDGDGRKDAISTTDGELIVVLSSNGKRVTAGVNADAPGPAEILGTADVDRDGRVEVFVQTAQGASTTFATPYRFDGTALQVVLRDDEPAVLGLGGSVTHGEGFRCTSSGLLEVSTAESSDGRTYRVVVDTFRLTKDQLVPVRTTTVTARQGDPAVQRAYTAQCGSVAASG